MKYKKNDIFIKNKKLLGDDVIDKLCKLKVAVVGAGGTGSPVLTQLCGLGINELIIIDGDELCVSNLNRQFLYSYKDIGENKAKLAKKYIEKKDFDINVKVYPEMINTDNIDIILEEADIIFDCVDNFKTTFLLNDYSVKKNKIMVHSGVNKDNGQIFIINGNKGKNLNSFFSDIPKEEENVNIVSAAMIVGGLQINEFLSFIRSGKISGMIFIEFYPNLNIKVLEV